MLDAVARMGEMRWYQRGPWVQRFARGLDAASVAPDAAPAAVAANGASALPDAVTARVAL
jgi:hypothetical protein